ncbi:hypothetical protein SDRG_05064 [Saprolegnia diclina VS20]|uniref:Uncharacterized protein n=1 Tax=Saprolegnia diclina (strain VS20) TaxID=1156394 RepID=T0QS18_SAPDV|nr:hypothetical protein SDRG_05064 [Saprolegnia diclina VS20]EQC37461.1 hypothetical protein SDRG_05064 [Saprolegnia diclina VS20]|eukprot:XP_008608981.1 hypothetical protein SDRG_05064 [Saprolegnia diclina VS20]
MATSRASTGRPSPSIASAIVASATPRGQDLLAIAKSQPETMREATHGEFDPTTLECAIHSLIVSESLAHLSPLGWWLHADALYLERLKISPPLLAAFFHFDFGPRRLSVMHFKLYEQLEIDAWHNTLRSAPSPEGLPVPPTPSTMNDIQQALVGLSMVVRRFGSKALQTLVDSADRAVMYLARECPDVASDLPALVRFLDAKLRAFRVAVLADVVATPMTTTHADVHKDFGVDSPGLGRFISHVLMMRTVSLARELNQVHATAPETTLPKAKSKKKKKSAATIVRKRRPTTKSAKTPVKAAAKATSTTKQQPRRGRIVVVVDQSRGSKRRGRGQRSTVL